MEQKERNVEKVGIILRPQSTHIKPIFLEIQKKLEKANIQVMLESSSAKMLDLESIESYDMQYLCKHVDMLFSIGGDGTLLSVANQSYGSNVPILGINSGRLGYLTIALPHEIDNLIPRIKHGEYSINKHLMLESYVKKSDMQENGGLEIPQPFVALNEFLLSRAGVSGMLEIEASIEGVLFNHYRLDGLLVATPTGSSAYNVSAGGSLVYPNCRNVLLTPICAHSLTQRPLILDDSFIIELKFKNAGTLICDGQQRISMPKDSVICIKTAEHNAHLVELTPNFYFMRLREKLGWGQIES